MITIILQPVYKGRGEATLFRNVPVVFVVGFWARTGRGGAERVNDKNRGCQGET